MIRPRARRNWRWRGIDRSECDHRWARCVEGVRPQPLTLPRPPKRPFVLTARSVPEHESASKILARQPTLEAREAARRWFAGEFDDDRPNDDFDEIPSDGRPPLPLVPWTPSPEQRKAFLEYIDRDHAGSSAVDVLMERHGHS
jgi:hypothetical protein